MSDKSARRRVSLRHVIATYDSEKAGRERRGEWPAAFFYRPVSFLLTPLCAFMGLKPDGISLLVIFLALCMPFIAWHFGPAGYLWIAGIGILIGILDCVDGNLARVLKLSSRRGAYLDFLGSLSTRLCLYLSLGLMIERDADQGEWTQWATALALLSINLVFMARLCRKETAKKRTDSALSASSTARTHPVVQFVFSLFSGIDAATPFIIFLGGLFNLLPWALILIIALALADFIYSQTSLKDDLA